MQRNDLPNAALHIGVFGHPGTGGFIACIARDGDGTDHALASLIHDGATNRQCAIGCHRLHARDMCITCRLPAGGCLGIRAVKGNGNRMGAGGSHRVAGLGQALIGQGGDTEGQDADIAPNTLHREGFLRQIGTNAGHIRHIQDHQRPGWHPFSGEKRRAEGHPPILRPAADHRPVAVHRRSAAGFIGTIESKYGVAHGISPS